MVQLAEGSLYIIHGPGCLFLEHAIGLGSQEREGLILRFIVNSKQKNPRPSVPSDVSGPVLRSVFQALRAKSSVLEYGD